MARLATIKPRVPTMVSRVRMPEPAYGQGRGGRPWRRLRAMVLKRDGFMCQCEECKGRTLIAHEVDHIVPLAEGGNDDPANLRAINRGCHAKKTQREARHARG